MFLYCISLEELYWQEKQRPDFKGSIIVAAVDIAHYTNEVLITKQTLRASVKQSFGISELTSAISVRIFFEAAVWAQCRCNCEFPFKKQIFSPLILEMYLRHVRFKFNRTKFCLFATGGSLTPHNNINSLTKITRLQQLIAKVYASVHTIHARFKFSYALYF